MSQVKQEDCLELLRKSYERLNSEFLSLLELSNAENRIKEMEQNGRKQKEQMKHRYNTGVAQYLRRIAELEEQSKNLRQQQAVQNKRQMRKYIQGINQREVQINNLKRQIISLKSKVSSLQQQINNLSNVKQNYEIFVLKAVDGIKSSIKEATSYVDDMENEKMIMQSKYRQQNQKITLIQNQVLEIAGQKNTLEENYNKLKHLFKVSKNQNLELKYQLQKHRQTTDKHNEAFNDKTEQMNDSQLLILKEIAGIKQLNNLLNSHESYLKQISQYEQMNRQLIQQNHALKIKNSELQKQIEQIKCEQISGEEDNILKQKEPSLYDFLLSKKEQVIQFQRRIEKIQSYMQQKDEKINKVISVMLEQQEQCKCGKAEEIQQLHNQLEQIKKKNSFFIESNQRQKNDITKYEAKVNQLIKELKELPKKKRTKGGSAGSMNRKCYHCLLSLAGKQGEQCQDCKRNYHSFICMMNHQCGAYAIDDMSSTFSIEKE